MRLPAGIAVAALTVALAACSLTAPFGFGLLFGTASGFEQTPAVVHAVGDVFGEQLSVGLGDIADDGGFLLTLDDPPSTLLSLVRPDGTVEFARGCRLSTFDISNASAAGMFVQYLAVVERPGLVSQLEDPLGRLLMGSSAAASQLFTSLGSGVVAAGDMAQSRLYVDRALRFSGTCTVGNVAVELDLDLQPGWNPLSLTVDRVRSDGRIEAGYRSTLGSDLAWFFWSLN